MRQFLTLLAVFICLTTASMGQSVSAKARIKPSVKVTASTLYKQILAQRSLLPGVKDPAFYTNMKKFEELEILRENCSIYLKNYGKLVALRKEANKVYQVQQSLKGYPVAKVEFDENMHLQNAIKSNH
jgi:hypothetical protein